MAKRERGKGSKKVVFGSEVEPPVLPPDGVVSQSVTRVFKVFGVGGRPVGPQCPGGSYDGSNAHVVLSVDKYEGEELCRCEACKGAKFRHADQAIIIEEK